MNATHVLGRVIAIFLSSAMDPSCSVLDLTELRFWRVQPSHAELYKIIRPQRGQKPILITATRMSGRKVGETVLRDSSLLVGEELHHTL